MIPTQATGVSRRRPSPQNVKSRIGDSVSGGATSNPPSDRTRATMPQPPRRKCYGFASLHTVTHTTFSPIHPHEGGPQADHGTQSGCKARDPLQKFTGHDSPTAAAAARQRDGALLLCYNQCVKGRCHGCRTPPDRGSTWPFDVDDEPPECLSVLFNDSPKSCVGASCEQHIVNHPGLKAGACKVAQARLTRESGNQSATRDCFMQAANSTITLNGSRKRERLGVQRGKMDKRGTR